MLLREALRTLLSFRDLIDTISTYVGRGGHLIRVRPSEDGLESLGLGTGLTVQSNTLRVSLPLSGLTDVLPYQAGNLLRVNGAGTGIEYLAHGNAVGLNAGTQSLNLVQLTSGGILPTLNGSLLTDLTASNIITGTLSRDRLPLVTRIRDEGIDRGLVNEMNFLGAGINVTVDAGVATLTLSEFGGFSVTSDTRILTANEILTSSSSRYLYLNPGAIQRDVVLPDPPSLNDWFTITNTGDGTVGLAIKTTLAAAATIILADSGEKTRSIIAHYDGVTWNIFQIGFYTGATEGGVSDGDKGDITVAGNSWIINTSVVTTSKIADGAVTLAKMAAVPNLTVLGNVSGGPATPTALTLGAGIIVTDSTLSVNAVTSVGLSLPSLFTITNSPITTTGTLSATLATQTSNTIFAGPSTGSAAAPTFRTLVAADIPALPASIINTGLISTARLGSGTADTTTYLRGDGSWATPAGTGGNPGGSNTQIQFNNNAAFGASPNLTWNGTELNVSGNVSISGAGRRIIGDFSNGTLANRTFLQTSGTNSETSLAIIPSGTSRDANFAIFNSTDVNNSSIVALWADSNSFARVGTTQLGTGTALPLRFIIGGIDRAQFDTSGNFSPFTNNQVSCGTSSLRWSNTFTTNLNVSGALTLPNSSITYANLQNVTTSRLLGRASSGSGVVEEITIGSGLTLTGTTLSAFGEGGGGSIAVSDEGTQVTANATSLNFTGAGVTATNSGGVVTVSIPNTGGGGSILISDTNNLVTANSLVLAHDNIPITLPPSPSNGDWIHINHTVQPNLVINTNGKNLHGYLDGIVTVTISRQNSLFTIYFVNGRWQFPNIITSFTLDPAIGVAFFFESHTAPTGLLNHIGRNMGQSSTYTNPIDGSIITATSSGNIDATRTPNKLGDRSIDGSIGIWHGSNSAFPEWVQLQLLGGRTFELSQVSIRASNQHQINRFTICGSNDGTNWTDIWTSPSVYSANTDNLTPANLSTTQFTYIRFQEHTNSDHFCIGEVELYGILRG